MATIKYFRINQIISFVICLQACCKKEQDFSKDWTIVKPSPKTQIPKAQPQPSQTQIQISSKGTGADTKILWATHPTTPPPTFKHEGGL